MASPGDIDLACQAMQELKGQLTSIANVGGGHPTAGLLTAAADDCAQAVMITNDDADVRIVNGAAARLTGLSTRELQTLTVWDITHPQSQADFDVLWKEFRRSGRQRGGYTLRDRTGAAVSVAYCSEANVLPGLHVFVLRKSS